MCIQVKEGENVNVSMCVWELGCALGCSFGVCKHVGVTGLGECIFVCCYMYYEVCVKMYVIVYGVCVGLCVV